MLTIQQIAKKVDGFRRAGARYVRFTDVKKGYDSLGRGYIAGASYSTHTIDQNGKPQVNRDRNKYVTVITFLDRKLHVKVSCSCSDQLFRWEVALNNKGASDIEYSNGELPTITNPRMKISLCKHTYALFMKIKDKLPPPQK